jgi:hypothetical protein
LPTQSFSTISGARGDFLGRRSQLQDGIQRGKRTNTVVSRRMGQQQVYNFPNALDVIADFSHHQKQPYFSIA